MKSKDKIVVVMGATGSGKSSLSVDLALHFKAEIINTDKMQFYDGLKVTTNQSTISERRGVPHHLLGELDPEDGEVTAAEFRNMAAQAIYGITHRKKLPILAGGSNSYIHALLANIFDRENYPFSHTGSICSELSYDCCFIWIDVDQPVLFEYLSLRLDKMLKTGMFEEIAEFHRVKKAPKEPIGIWKAIGVQEFDDYLRMYKWDNDNMEKWDPVRKEAYEKAVRAIKENTFQLTKDQIKKISKLRTAGWDIRKVDATATFREAIRGAKEGDGGDEMQKKIWNKEVVKPCVEIVKMHLEQQIN